MTGKPATLQPPNSQKERTRGPNRQTPKAHHVEPEDLAHAIDHASDAGACHGARNAGASAGTGSCVVAAAWGAKLFPDFFKHVGPPETKREDAIFYAGMRLSDLQAASEQFREPEAQGTSHGVYVEDGVWRRDPASTSDSVRSAANKIAEAREVAPGMIYFPSTNRVWWGGSNEPLPPLAHYALDEYVTAWRVWRITGENDGKRELVSAAYGEHRWPGGKPLEEAKPVPDRGQVGIHGFKESSNAWNVYGKLRSTNNPNSSAIFVTVLGKVALWGTVIEHEIGYRAQYGYPLKIWVPTTQWQPHAPDHPFTADQVAASLARNYGCDVGTFTPPTLPE